MHIIQTNNSNASTKYTIHELASRPNKSVLDDFDPVSDPPSPSLVLDVVNLDVTPVPLSSDVVLSSLTLRPFCVGRLVDDNVVMMVSISDGVGETDEVPCVSVDDNMVSVGETDGAMVVGDGVTGLGVIGADVIGEGVIGEGVIGAGVRGEGVVGVEVVGGDVVGADVVGLVVVGGLMVGLLVVGLEVGAMVNSWHHAVGMLIGGIQIHGGLVLMIYVIREQLNMTLVIIITHKLLPSGMCKSLQIYVIFNGNHSAVHNNRDIHGIKTIYKQL